MLKITDSSRKYIDAKSQPFSCLSLLGILYVAISSSSILPRTSDLSIMPFRLLWNHLCPDHMDRLNNERTISGGFKSRQDRHIPKSSLSTFDSTTRTSEVNKWLTSIANDRHSHEWQIYKEWVAFHTTACRQR